MNPYNNIHPFSNLCFTLLSSLPVSVSTLVLLTHLHHFQGKASLIFFHWRFNFLSLLPTSIQASKYLKMAAFTALSICPCIRPSLVKHYISCSVAPVCSLGIFLSFFFSPNFCMMHCFPSIVGYILWDLVNFVFIWLNLVFVLLGV